LTLWVWFRICNDSCDNDNDRDNDMNNLLLEMFEDRASSLVSSSSSKDTRNQARSRQRERNDEGVMYVPPQPTHPSCAQPSRKYTILTSIDGFDNTILLSKPPMVFSREDVRAFLECLKRVVLEDFPRWVVADLEGEEGDGGGAIKTLM
jgi:hypothetical protein